MKKNLVILFLACLMFFILGYFIGGTNVKENKLLINNENTFAAGWDAAKKRLLDTPTIAIMSDSEVKNLVGEVVNINNDKIIIKIVPLEPLADKNLDERVIKIDEDTKINIIEPKDQEVYQKEIKDYYAKISNQSKNISSSAEVLANNIMFPEAFDIKDGNISNINVSSKIYVIAADKDIKNAKEFTAAKINIQSVSASLPAATNLISAPEPITPPITE